MPYNRQVNKRIMPNLNIVYESVGSYNTNNNPKLGQ